MTHVHSQKSWQDVSKVVKKAMSSRVELYIVVLSKLSLYGLSINHPIYLIQLIQSISLCFSCEHQLICYNWSKYLVFMLIPHYLTVPSFKICTVAENYHTLSKKVLLYTKK